jgi:hypothetical protein
VLIESSLRHWESILIDATLRDFQLSSRNVMRLRGRITFARVSSNRFLTRLHPISFALPPSVPLPPPSLSLLRPSPSSPLFDSTSHAAQSAHGAQRCAKLRSNHGSKLAVAALFQASFQRVESPKFVEWACGRHRYTYGQSARHLGQAL